MEVNVLEHIDSETGEFKDSFREQIPVIAGEEFKDTKLFDQIKNLNNLVKTYAHTQKAYDTKMDGVIKPPKEDASDEEKAQFRAKLHRILGTPEKPDDYEFPRPGDMPEGAVYDEEAEKTFRGLFHKHGLTSEAVKEIVDAHNQIIKARLEGQIKAANEKFETDSTALKNDWKGDNLVANARIAYNALNQFADDELKELLKEAQIYDKAADLTKWRELGISPYQLRIWHNIGTKMKSPDVSNEGDRKSADKHPAQQFYDKSPELFEAKT